MAITMKLMRTCGILFLAFSYVQASVIDSVEPRIVTINVDNIFCEQSYCKYYLSVSGGPFLGYHAWRLTPSKASRGKECDSFLPNYEIKEIKTLESETKIEVSLPYLNSNIYFCLRVPESKNSPYLGKWVHQGSDLFLDFKNLLVYQKDDHQLPQRTSQEPLQPINTSEKANLQQTNIDLTHDIDINNSTKAEASNHERKDIEVMVNDKYIPLDQLYNDTQYVNDNKDLLQTNDNLLRKKRDVNDDNLNSTLPNLTENKDLNEESTKNETEHFLLSPQEIYNAHVDSNNIKPAENRENHEDALIKIRKQRQVQSLIKLDGLRVEESEKDPKIYDSIPSVLADTQVTLRLTGSGLTENSVIAFTDVAAEYGQPCKYLLKGEYKIKEGSLRPNTGLFEVIAPASSTTSKFYICAKNLQADTTDPTIDNSKYIHQGQEEWLILGTHDKILPLWVTIILVLICLTFSALFSGLNLGLMSLDRTELKIISNTGTEKEKAYARAIIPVRDHGNYLLCSILLANVAVNSTFTILLDDLTSGLFAVIFSTLMIVLLGEITPQAICSRHGLMIGAKSIAITKIVMGIAGPLAFPVSKLLDYFLGEEIGNVYNRERLKELVKVTTGVNDLDKDEVNIIAGALEMRKKTVADVMTKLEDAFMLPITSLLDFETMSEIVKSGFSRIPVYEGHRGNIVTVLFIKDLAFVDPDDNTPLRTLCQYYQNQTNFVFEDVTLDVMFRQFKEGHKGHMAFVHRINTEGEGDPFYETIGLLTLEDVIEEMIQAEIVDETDVFTDNKSKRRRKGPANKWNDFAAFAERHENQRIHISPQLTLATFQFLSTSVDAFKPEIVSERVLRRLLRQDVIQHIKLKGKSKKDPSTYVFQQGKSVDYFVLILEGRVEVTVGRENLVFEAGPFTYFGVQALTQNVGLADSPTASAQGSLQNITMDAMLRHSFVPDYSVRAITELFYLTVKRQLYLAAKRASLMEKGQLSKSTNEQFDTEVDKPSVQLNTLEMRQAMSCNLTSASTHTDNTNFDDLPYDTDSPSTSHFATARAYRSLVKLSENKSLEQVGRRLEKLEMSVNKKLDKIMKLLEKIDVT